MKAFIFNNSLDPEVADVLCEIGNVGVGQATTALGNMLGECITIETPQAFCMSDDISELSGLAPDTIVMGILMKLAQNLGGAVMILFNKDFMSDLIGKLTGTHYPDEELINNEDSLSAIQEVANIMASSYMNAIGAYTGLRIYMTPVMVGIDMVGALIAYPLAQMSLSKENIICIDTSFEVKDSENKIKKCDGRIIMMPDNNSVDILLQALDLN